jgi:ubiquinone/menaquinone biosynthesis C-methylase UbiE
MDLNAEITTHYSLQQREENRLLEGAGALEFIRTRELLARNLPPPPAVVADVGGGAGVYAVPLAAEGYEVHLLDPVPRHVDLARQASDSLSGRPLAEVVAGDARDLPWSEGTFDAALLLGPLYHLTEREDRLRTLAEARRVTRSGGIVAAAAISRFASTYDGIFRGYIDDPAFEEIFERDVREGQHRNPTERVEWFTTACFHLPGEFAAEIRESGLTLEGVFAIEGPASWMGRDIEPVLRDPDRRERLLRAIRRVEGETSILGASDHLLALARSSG